MSVGVMNCLFMFIMNQKCESYREDLYMSIGVMKD